MIELPEDPAPNGVQVTPVDAGFLLRSATASSLLRVDRAGSHYQAEISFPPMEPEVADRFVVRIERAKRQGLRVDYPLLGRGQSGCGSPVVHGSGQAGTSLVLRGLTPSFAVKEGFKFTVVDADDNRALHKVAEPARVAANGRVTLSIEPPLRLVLLDGATVLMARPTIEGMITGDVPQVLSVDRLVRFGATIVIEESAGRIAALPPTFDDTDTFTFDMDE